MEAEVQSNEEYASNRKRKRSIEGNSSGDENSNSDQEEYELFTKYFADSCSKSEQVPDPNPEIQLPLKSGAPSRKRKYVYKSDVAPKKCRKFYYINELMTKPRKPKINTPKGITTENKKTEIVFSKKCKMHFAKVNANGTLCLMHRLYIKSDLFFDDEKKCYYEDSKKFDLAFHIVDEIALEGLDGVTIEAFWKRLKNIFPNHISKNMADRIWRTICNNKRINFYILKEAREELIFYDRCKYLDIDSGMFIEPFVEIKDIYPLASINGAEIRGSCSTFHTRKENNGVRKFSLDKALKLYDQRLVFVADQTLRNKALINEEVDPHMEILDVEYCMLEKVGRSRCQGEFTQGKLALSNDSKRVYHNRKVLIQNLLIVNQNFSLKSLSMQQNISGTLVHLSRFYRKRKTKHIAIMERIANLLRSKPNYQIEITEFRKIFGRNISIIKMMKSPEFRKFFKVLTFPYKKLYPNASKQEYLHKNKQKERQIRVIRMIDPCANITAIMDSKDTKESVQKGSDHSIGHKLMNYEYLRDVFLYILSTGQTGVTIHEIHEYFKTDFYSIRMAVRKLLLRNVIVSCKIDLGRQQCLKFLAKCIATPDSHVKTEQKNYQLSDETLIRVIKGYETKTRDLSITYSSEPDQPVKLAPIQTQFKLNFDNFCCSAFLTETVDATSEELTICDIVIKGRDKLLLIGSNLFAQYISEWDDYLLKKDDFSKGIQLFQSGFGKEIYDYLTTVRVNESIEVDNSIVFDLNNVTAETKIGRQFLIHRMVNISTNYNNPHSDNNYIDLISKVYLFEAMFNENHINTRCTEILKNVFEHVMISEGKQKIEKNKPLDIQPKIEVEVAPNIVMGKFMGPHPCLEWCNVEEDIRIEIFGSTRPETIMPTGSMFTTDDDSFTQRYINRANSILRLVNDQAIVRDVRTIYKDILKEEDEEGYDRKACKKSIVSIISKLVSEGYIKCYQIVMTSDNRSKTQCFICIHEVDAKHIFIRSTIDQLKLKFYIGPTTQKPITIRKKQESPFSSSDVKDSIAELRQLTNGKTDLCYTYDKTRGKSYGYVPKFVRMRVLHEHLFYLLRDLTDCEQLSTRQVFDLCKNLKIKLTQNDLSEIPPVYRNEVSWKMFIPPLPKQTRYPKGWALACDVVLRMPLSVFVKLVNICYDIPELDEYLSHPFKRHYLLKYLPTNIRNVLLYRRKYFHSIYDVIANLCYIGLLQLGPRSFKEKDQLFVYLNSKATLYDTCSSKPGYNQIEDKKYKKIPFDFKTANDIEIYWSEVLRICLNTQLGKRKVLDGQYITIEDSSAKPELVNTLKAQTFEGAVTNDTGKIPGDRKGSAGFDSSLWSFVKRNWSWQYQVDNKTPSNMQSQISGLGKENFSALPESIQQDLTVKGGPPERKVFLKPPKKSTYKINAVKSILIKTNAKKKKIIRKIVAPKKKRTREYYDAIDKSIMKKHPALRVDWDEEEDQLLRYCRVVLVFLCPVFRKQFIPYNIMRDVLHRLYPKSKNKTARAVQRRIYVLLTHDEAIKIMETNVDNMLNSEVISKYFDQIRNRYKNNIKLTDKQIYILFVYLMAYVYKHRKEIELLLLGYFATFDFFSEGNITEFEPIIQKCVEENTSLYTHPKNVEDVTVDTIKSIIHCSMACRKNSLCWPFHLTRIYKKFQDNLIRDTVSKLKKDQLFVSNKNFGNKHIDNIWPTPIKFSFNYNSMKTSTYTLETYRETYKNFLGIVDGEVNPEIVTFMVWTELNSYWEAVDLIFDIPELGIILNPEIEDHSEVVEELAKRFQLYLKKIFEKNVEIKDRSVVVNNADTCSKAPERSIEEIKSEVKHLIFRVPYLFEGNLEICFKKMLETTESAEIMNYIHLMTVDLKKFAETSVTSEELKKFVVNIEEKTTVDDLQILLKDLSKVVFAIQNMHQQQTDDMNFEDAFKLWEYEVLNEVGTNRKIESERSSNQKSLFNKNYVSGMENCINRAKEGDFPTLEEIKEGIMTEVANINERKIPHITDLIMFLNEDRFPELESDKETIEKMKDHFIMMYPKLTKFAIENVEEFKDNEVTKKISGDIAVKQVEKFTKNFINQPKLDEIVTYIQDHNGTEDDIKITENLIDFIKEKKELGATARDLKTAFMNKTQLNLVELLNYLGEINLILRTGIVSIVYVHHEYQSEWLTETFMFSDKEKEVLELRMRQDMKEAKKNLKSLIGEKIQLAKARKVQLKPWSKLDGSLNGEVFQEWLCIILSKCIDLPNIPFLTLCEQFHFIKPVDIYLLLEVLQEIGCVEINVFINVASNVFSERNVLEECNATCLDGFDEMFVKPSNVSGLCFGSFLEFTAF